MKIALVIALLVGLCLFALHYQEMGTSIVDLTAERKQLTGQVDTLNGQVDGLTKDTASLGRKILKAENKLLQAQKDAAEGRADGQAKLNGYQYKLDQGNQQVDKLSSRVVKAEADAAVARAGYGKLPTTVSDSAANAIIVKQDGELRQYKEVIVPALVQENQTLTQDNKKLTDKVSDLEISLNGVRAYAADQIEGVLAHKPPLNIGLAKKMQRKADQIRAGRK